MELDDNYQIETSNPCGEQPLPKNFCCNLGSLNLSAFVKNQFSDFYDGFNATTYALYNPNTNNLDIKNYSFNPKAGYDSAQFFSFSSSNTQVVNVIGTRNTNVYHSPGTPSDYSFQIVSPGTATITATQIETKNYPPTSITYTITVVSCDNDNTLNTDKIVKSITGLTISNYN
jgi:hypothetical protein